MRRPSPHRPGFGRFQLAVALCLLSGATALSAPLFRSNDVVAFAGGASVVAADHAGAVEMILTLSNPGLNLRFRNVGWEGDSIFEQPRELNFPPLTQVLRQTQATVVCTQFGSLEALDPAASVEAFRGAYGRLLDQIIPVTPRVVLVIPPPFEPQSPPLPNFARPIETLAAFAGSIRSLAASRQLPLIDLHQVFVQQPPAVPWTFDGRELNPAGHRTAAAAWAKELGEPALAKAALDFAFWKRDDIAPLHAAVTTKNRLWFDYWRPMNWAFLHGDRTEQQSSRDHRDRAIRWFPSEMEQFVPLIVEAEIRIESLAAQVRLRP